MSCTNCNNSNGPLVVGGIAPILASFNTPCSSTGCPSPIDAKCTFYSGPNLACSGVNTNDSLELVIQKVDTLLCASAANYSTYNVYCLAPVTTQQSWVEKISQYVCNLNTTVTTFISTTFPTYQTSINTRFVGIETPGTTSSCSTFLNILPGDTIQVVLQKLANSVCGVYNGALDLSSVNWSQCFTVSTPPTTIAGGFTTVISQLCQIATSAGNAVLPVFNNTGSCLAAPLTTTDTLVSTVNKIKVRLCQTPTFDINTLTWTCIAKPTTTTTDLQSAFQALLNKIDALSQNNPTFSSDFTVVATNPGNTCLGKTVSLAASIADRKVAATSLDNTPGTLQDKIIAGTGIALDFATDPTKVSISVTSLPTPSDGKVKADSTDATSDYLYNKVESGPATNGITIVPGLDTAGSSHLVNFTANTDPKLLFTYLLNYLINSGDTELKLLFCQAVASCPSPCAAPTNVSVSFGGSTSTTTTTTSGSSTSTTTTTTGAPTTTTTSTTTTTTAAPLDNIYVGAQSSSTPPNSAAILAGTLTTQNAALDVNANWVPFNATPQYCWVAIPTSHPKTKWQDTVNLPNHGNIGSPSDLFDAPTSVTLSGTPYLLYFTTFQTQFANNVAMQA